MQKVKVVPKIVIESGKVKVESSRKYEKYERFRIATLVPKDPLNLENIVTD